MAALKKSLAEMEGKNPTHPTRGAQVRNAARDHRMNVKKKDESKPT
jgi:hypothetical protein